MPSFKDLFSGHAARYAAARPTYPDALFDWLATLVPRAATVLDAGCGNGQASVALAGRFARVIATDPSAQQIANAAPQARVSYRVAPAEASGLPDASVDLVTAAQAVHWFDHARFAAECRRVLRPGGAVVVWCYGLNAVSPAVDGVTRRLYGGEDGAAFVGPYWEPERRYIDEGLRTLPFPFAELAAPAFRMTARWTLRQFVDYLGTWSAVQRYRQDRGADPVAALAAELERAWGDPATVREVAFPLAVRAGRVA